MQHKRDVWSKFAEDGAAKLNCFQEEDEEKRKDELKQRKEGNITIEGEAKTKKL